MRASTVALIGAFCYEYPEFLPLLDEHLRDNDGEVLPHLFLSDVVRWLVVHTEDEVRSRLVWSWLERAYTRGDEDEKDLIAVSAVEMIPDPGQPGSGMREFLSPALQAVDPWRI